MLPSPISLATAGLALLVGLRCAVSSWIALFEHVESRSALAYYFVVSQLGKYIPGGFWQFIGQVSFASEAGATISRASSALPVHLVVQAAAGGTLGALTGALQSSAPPALRLMALASGGLVVLLNRNLLIAAVRLGHRFGLGKTIGGDIPSQRAIFESVRVGNCHASLLRRCVCLTALFDQFRVPWRVTYVGVFALAWLAGFLAIPIPAGLGVREAVMVMFLSRSAGGIIAASLCHRILAMALESVVVLVARVRLK